MITIEQLNELNYQIKNRSIYGGLIDLINPEKDYLISLSEEGEVTVVYPASTGKTFHFNDYDTFLNFHNNN